MSGRQGSSSRDVALQQGLAGAGPRTVTVVGRVSLTSSLQFNACLHGHGHIASTPRSADQRTNRARQAARGWICFGRSHVVQIIKLAVLFQSRAWMESEVVVVHVGVHQHQTRALQAAGCSSVRSFILWLGCRWVQLGRSTSSALRG